ncbi:endonuclease/exonuclease/phosphatase family protein [Streptomyces laurentii]|uniref:endonuclease/exonuclease/phosphatase family protein n=1 Tax=Streptomyces laurentii TaxID=39478 RepID=UPI003680D7F7
MKRLRILASWLGTLLLLGGTAPVAQAEEPKNLQVMTWNMCGSQRDTWNCAGTGTPDQKTDVVKYHVDTNYVQVALLQEICEDDLTLLMGKLGSTWNKSFFPYKWSQNGVTWNSRCGNDGPADRADRIGTAIVVKGPIADARQYPITVPWTGPNQPFQCATAVWWNTTVCNAHLTLKGSNPDHPDWDYRDDQLAEIQAIVAGFPHMVIGGDFNAQPPDSEGGKPSAWIWPDGFYSTGPDTPGYLECDQTGAERTGRPTHDGGWKLDYLFSGETRRWCALGASAYSDHHVMIESVAVS